MPREFDDKFFLWAEKIEKLLFRMVVIGLVVLITVQTLLTQETPRFFLSYVDRIEGKSYKPEIQGQGRTALGQNVTQHRETVVLKVINPSKGQEKVKLLLNGKPVGCFEQNTITVEVENGDLLEIDASACLQTLVFEIVTISDNLLEPKNGTKFEIKGTVQKVAKVKTRW